MYKEVLANIDGVSLFPVIAIVLFMIIFSLITYYTIKMDKRKIGELSFIPLEDDPTPSVTTHGKTQN